MCFMFSRILLGANPSWDEGKWVETVQKVVDLLFNVHVQCFCHFVEVCVFLGFLLLKRHGFCYFAVVFVLL